MNTRQYKFLLLFFFTSLCFSQQEASIWYFGENAGIKFHTDGAVTPLADGKLVTDEGCATLSDIDGNLLFYTDGVTVWNKNHQIMSNGTGLKGHSSSSQSATIIQKPGSANIFYIFTIDVVARPDGLRYSEVDMNLNGGLGDVNANKNVFLYAPTCEKIAIVKHNNGNDYWVVTHGYNDNRFYSHLVTSSGVSTSPVNSSAGTIVDNSRAYNTQGCMKLSPNGRKIALCHQFLSLTEMFDFDNSTGIVSNPVFINDKGQPYGVEFSPDSQILYVSLQIGKMILQYDLNAVDVASSEKLLTISPYFLGALQLGPNNKIYIANYQDASLGVINNPNILGDGCDYQTNAVGLAGKRSILGLPSFCQSFFSPTFTIKNQCLGETSEFKLNTSQQVISAYWEFGDGTFSYLINPLHQYSSEGKYNVTVTATLANTTGSSTKSKEVTIYRIPAVSKPQDILICDNDNDGLYSFDLTTQNSTVLNGQDFNLYDVTYFSENQKIVHPNSYTNQNAYQQITIKAEVSNKNNGECKSNTSFVINVFDSPLPEVSTAIPDITICDNTSVGTDFDERITFDLTQRATTILKGQSASQFLITYYKDAALSQQISTPTSYQNDTATETIYVKIANKDNLYCIATTSFKIKVYALPVINSIVDLKQCDDDIGGFSIFNLEEAITKITSNAANVTISFFKTIADAQNNSNPILNTTNYANRVVSNDNVYVKVSNSNSCFRIATLNLIISTTQIPITFSKSFTQCDDLNSGSNTDGIATFDFSSVTNQIANIFPSGQLLDITYYRNLTDALVEKNKIVDISKYSNIGYPNSQKIYIRVDSKLNNDCLGLGGYITLNVESIPIAKNLVENHCDDNHDGMYAFDTSNIELRMLNDLTNVTISYFDKNNNALSSPLPNPFVTASQLVKVKIANKTATGCSCDATIQFVVDDLPEAFSIPTSMTTACDDEINPAIQDGKYPFDTSSFQNSILGNQTGMIVKYFDSNGKVLPSPLPNPFLTATKDVKVEVVNPINLSCTATTIIPFKVNSVPNIQLTGDELVCSDLPSFTKNINAGLIDESQKDNYIYNWYLNGNLIQGETAYELTVNKKGIYTVEAISNFGCSRVRTITVNASDKAMIEISTVDLSDENSITVIATGAGNYVYSLDDEAGFYDTNNVFINVLAGIHNVFVKDLNGCGITSKEVAVLGIPKFFTPNNDGANDTWNIKGTNASFNGNTTIQIFDRYGKLLKQINPSGDGWDGTYLGKQMPSDDYWYIISLQDGRIFKSHFALKR